MFKVEENPQFTHEVECQRPVDGGFEAANFTATFRLLPDEDLESFGNDATGERELLTAVVINLTDIVGPDKKPIPYNDGLRDMMIGQAFVRSAMIKTYFTAILGHRVKN